MISGVFLGFIYDKYGKKTTLILILNAMVLGGLFTYLGYVYNSFALFFPAVAFYGASDVGMHTLTGALFTEKFGVKFEPHAAFRFVFGNSMGLTVAVGSFF